MPTGILYSMTNQSRSSFTLSQKALFSSWTSLRPSYPLITSLSYSHPEGWLRVCPCLRTHLVHQIKPQGGISVLTLLCVSRLLLSPSVTPLGLTLSNYTSFLACFCLPTPACHPPGAVQFAGREPSNAIHYVPYIEWPWSPFHIHHPLPQPHFSSLLPNTSFSFFF